MVAGKHYLPSKLNSYLRRLNLGYEGANFALLREILTSVRIAVKEETSYDNWNGGTYGHDVILFLPPEMMAKIAFPKQKEFCDQIARDLNMCAEAIDNESIRAVVIELFDESDPLFQGATSLIDQPQTNPDTLSIWRPGYIRLFISHRDAKKAEAKQLADALETYGVSAFVAHDTIEPMSTWQREIEKGLETMEIMLAFITDDFHESSWTNQEIGYALGKDIPVIPVKLEGRDPDGFIGATQAVKGRLEQPGACVKKIAKSSGRRHAFSGR
jgi:TIR domain